MERVSDRELADAGLLDGVEGEQARASRLALLHDLLASGASLEELRDAAAEERLALLPVERVLANEGALYSARELAEDGGLPLDFGVAIYQALGFPISDPDEPRFTETDREAARSLALIGQAGLGREAVLETTRVVGESMARVAAAFRLLVAEGVRRPGDTERDLSLRYAQAARELIPATAPILQSVLSLHLRELVRHEAVQQAELNAERIPGQLRVAVCFADLVDFTRTSEMLDPEGIGSLATRLHALASDHVRPPVRLVKTIGDAAMLVSREPRALVDAALEMVAASGAGGLPPLRAGVAAGDALERGGDFYGRPVNLASRLCDVARPGSVVVDERVRAALAAERHRLSRLPPRRLKGISETPRLYRVRAAAADAA